MSLREYVNLVKNMYSAPPHPAGRWWRGVGLGEGGVPLNRRELIIPDINGQKKKQNKITQIFQKHDVVNDKVQDHRSDID